MEKDGNVLACFSRYSRLLAHGGGSKRVSLQFDDAQREFAAVWTKVHEQVKDQPEHAAAAAKELIGLQPQATALVLAMSRLDSIEVFGRFKRFLEVVLNSTERFSGYPAIRGIPHVQAGFLYMAAAVMALHWEAWGILEKLLNNKFEWYYQSGRALFSYPFEMPYFFHSEAFGRDAARLHDFFRKELATPDIARVTQLNEENTTDAYSQAQMLMSLKAAALLEKGESVRIWPDFGRFYSHRVVRLIDRAYDDTDFSTGLLRAFGEDRHTFFSHLNDRLKIIQTTFFKGSPYFYESLGYWEPKEAHA